MLRRIAVRVYATLTLTKNPAASLRSPVPTAALQENEAETSVVLSIPKNPSADLLASAPRSAVQDAESDATVSATKNGSAQLSINRTGSADLTVT